MFNKSEHILNELTNKCILCGYEDPVACVNDEGVMTSLTPHAKTNYTVSIPSTVKLPKELRGYFKGAFDNCNVKTITTEEEEVRWIDKGDLYEKYDVITNNEAMIGDKWYAKFKFPIAIIADTTFDLYYANGSFTSLTLGSGIKSRNWCIQFIYWWRYYSFFKKDSPYIICSLNNS